jgi:hypothetical protein
MQPFIELGVDYFMLDCAGFPNLTTLQILIDAVLPAFSPESHQSEAIKRSVV